MSSAGSSSLTPSLAPSPHWGETFLNRFDLKVRNAGQIVHPHSGEAFHVDPKTQAQSFRRIFGYVAQFPLTTGMLKKERFTLAAIRLEPTDPLRSADNLLQMISGPEGLDFRDEAYYCVGIFSPGGWPAEWKNHAEARGNALFYLIEKGAGTRWNVFGPGGALREIFDPETKPERRARADQALAGHPRLVLAGDQVAHDLFLEENDLDQESVGAAIEASHGQFQMFEHKGKSYIQRFSR